MLLSQGNMVALNSTLAVGLPDSGASWGYCKEVMRGIVDAGLIYGDEKDVAIWIGTTIQASKYNHKLPSALFPGSISDRLKRMGLLEIGDYKGHDYASYQLDDVFKGWNVGFFTGIMAFNSRRIFTTFDDAVKIGIKTNTFINKYLGQVPMNHLPESWGIIHELTATNGGK